MTSKAERIRKVKQAFKEYNILQEDSRYIKGKLEGRAEALKEVETEFDKYFTIWTEKWVTNKVTARTLSELKGFKQKLQELKQ